jgi:hypothetical protein
MAKLASITPLSTSRSAVSTRRAKNGAAPTTSGGIAPRHAQRGADQRHGQRDHHDQQDHEGHRAQHVDQQRQHAVGARFCSIWPLPVRNRITPSGRPSATVSTSEPPSMDRVSMVAWPISANPHCLRRGSRRSSGGLPAVHRRGRPTPGTGRCAAARRRRSGPGSAGHRASRAGGGCARPGSNSQRRSRGRPRPAPACRSPRPGRSGAPRGPAEARSGR